MTKTTKRQTTVYKKKPGNKTGTPIKGGMVLIHPDGLADRAPQCGTIRVARVNINPVI